MTFREQDRDPRTGRYSHTWGGVVAQDTRGDIERCDGCGALRAWGGGGWRVVREASIAPAAWFGSERDAWQTEHPSLLPYDIQPVCGVRTIAQAASEHQQRPVSGENVDVTA